MVLWGPAGQDLNPLHQLPALRHGANHLDLSGLSFLSNRMGFVLRGRAKICKLLAQFLPHVHVLSKDSVNARTQRMQGREIILAGKRPGAKICILSFVQIWDEKMANI